MLPELKMYKINYDFIIKNYLDRNMWKKVWTLFVYKDLVITLNLYEINTKDNEIRFEIKEKNSYSTQYITYNIDNTSIKILIKQINGAIFRLIERYEESLIEMLPKYRELLSAMYEERDMLRNIASDFLDENGVTSEHIREAYIDAYVDDNETIYSMMCSFKESNKYLIQTELYLIFCKITNDDARMKTIIDANKENPLRLAIIEKDTEEFINNLNTEEHIDELKDMLEAI